MRKAVLAAEAASQELKEAQEHVTQLQQEIAEAVPAPPPVIPPALTKELQHLTELLQQVSS
eukprot:11329744-Prorocentrum_lima.AAC.1